MYNIVKLENCYDRRRRPVIARNNPRELYATAKPTSRQSFRRNTTANLFAQNSHTTRA